MEEKKKMYYALQKHEIEWNRRKNEREREKERKNNLKTNLKSNSK